MCMDVSDSLNIDIVAKTWYLRVLMDFSSNREQNSSLASPRGPQLHQD